MVSLIAALLLVCIVRAAGLCPIPCRCQLTVMSTRHLTDCSNASLYAVPAFDVRTHELLACCNHITKLATDTFASLEMPELTRVELYSNRISMIERPSLRVFPQLETLLLGNNLITWLPRDVFRDTPRLRALDLSRNPFRTPPRLDIPRLDWLSLSHCNFTHLPPDTFSYTPRLENIKLNNNRLQSIDVNLFTGLKLLSYLHLEGNNLVTINPDTFKLNPKFIWLNISENMISLPEDTAFLNAEELDMLDIGYCNIKKLPAKSLANLSKLRQLRLNGNHLLSLDGELFLTLQALEDLELQSNQILHLDFLKSLGKLTYLDMAYNELSSLELDVLKSMPRLRTLYITGNPLTCDCNVAAALNWCSQQRIVTAFDDVDCLESLHLMQCDVVPHNYKDTPELGQLTEFQGTVLTSKGCPQQVPIPTTKESCRVALYLAVLLGMAVCVIISLVLGLVIMRRRLRLRNPHSVQFVNITPSRSVDSETFLQPAENTVHHEA